MGLIALIVVLWVFLCLVITRMIAIFPNNSPKEKLVSFIVWFIALLLFVDNFALIFILFTRNTALHQLFIFLVALIGACLTVAISLAGTFLLFAKAEQYQKN